MKLINYPKMHTFRYNLSLLDEFGTPIYDDGSGYPHLNTHLIGYPFLPKTNHMLYSSNIFN